MAKSAKCRNVFLQIASHIFVSIPEIISRMGRRFKRDGKGKKKSGGGVLRQEDLDYLAKNTSMSKEDIQEYYKAINH